MRSQPSINVELKPSLAIEVLWTTKCEVVVMNLKNKLSGLILVSITAVFLIPGPADARGVGFSAGAVGTARGAMGGMLGAGASLSSRFNRFFPFFGGGGGYFGGYPELAEPLAAPLPLPPPQQIAGPMQVQVLLPQALPLATATRTNIVDGVPVTVSSPLVTDYFWPEKQAHPIQRHGLARILK
jgi:hypothetical protein